MKSTSRVAGVTYRKCLEPPGMAPRPNSAFAAPAAQAQRSLQERLGTVAV